MDNLEIRVEEKLETVKAEEDSLNAGSAVIEIKHNGSSPSKNMNKPAKMLEAVDDKVKLPTGGKQPRSGTTKISQEKKIDEDATKIISSPADDHASVGGETGAGDSRVHEQVSHHEVPVSSSCGAALAHQLKSPQPCCRPNYPKSVGVNCLSRPGEAGLVSRKYSACDPDKPGSGNSVAGKPSDKNTKRNRDQDKPRKKDDKSVEHVLKALSSLETTEEKLGAMCQKYAEIVNEHRILQSAAKLCEKKNSILQREKEQLQADHSKAILTRSRLENLCRELQRQNKAVKEECMLKIREEEEKKREVATKFQSTLTELGTLLAQNNDKNAKLRDDNIDMTTKLKSVCEQYERKEQHVEKLAKQMKLEMQLADAKLAKAKMEMAMEKETLLREKQQLLVELSQYQTQLEEMRISETALRNQIQLYNDKYDEFHQALLQSNEAIGGFKQEMERMSKQIRKLEKETVSWKSRYEAAHRTLLQMTQEKLKSDRTASASSRKLVALQGLCRSLQAQCTSLRGELKAVAPSTPARSDQDDELMNQVEKELNETTSDEGLASDSSPCPRQLLRDSADKYNGDATSSEDLSDKEALVDSLALSEGYQTNPTAELEASTTLSPPTPEPLVLSSPNRVVNPPPIIVQQTKKNKTKKKNKK